MGLRVQKDAAEIERIRAACELVQEGLRRAFEWLTPGVVEQALNARVEAFLREQGATDAHPLILFGENAANPHGNPGPRELQEGDVVCADLSACLDGYWGDLTRCATVGPASEWATKHVAGGARRPAGCQRRRSARCQRPRRGRSPTKTHRGGQRPRRLPARRGPRDRPLDPRAPVPRPALERPARRRARC